MLSNYYNASHDTEKKDKNRPTEKHNKQMLRDPQTIIMLFYMSFQLRLEYLSSTASSKIKVFLMVGSRF